MSFDDRSADDRSARSAVRGIAGFVAAVIVVNVVVRLLPLPDIDLPAISFPDLPAWVDTVLKVKNWVLIALVVAIVIGISARPAWEASGTRLRRGPAADPLTGAGIVNRRPGHCHGVRARTCDETVGGSVLDEGGSRRTIERCCVRWEDGDAVLALRELWSADQDPG
jgi:hypothetical protein